MQSCALLGASGDGEQVHFSVESVNGGRSSVRGFLLREMRSSPVLRNVSPPPPVCSRRDEGGLAVCVRWGHAIATGCFCLVRKAVLPPSPWGTKPARTAHHLEGHSPPSKAESHRFFNSAKSADLGTSCGYEFLGFYLKTGEFQGSSEVPVSDRSQGRGGVYFWAGPGPGGDEGSPWVQNVKGDRETQDLR